MAEKHDSTTEVMEGVEQTLTRTEQFLETNKKPLGIAIGAIIGLVLAIYAFNEYYTKPLNLEAQNEMFRAQAYLEQDSLRLALEGDGVNLGFLDIADSYGSTKSGNLAKYYAGVCYLNMGKFEDAIAYLDDYSGKDDVIATLALAGIGDAFLELGQRKEALEYYSKAIKNANNQFVTPNVLFKAAQVCELEGDHAKALKYFNRIKSEFKDSREAADIDKYIARAEVKK